MNTKLVPRFHMHLLQITSGKLLDKGEIAHNDFFFFLPQCCQLDSSIYTFIYRELPYICQYIYIFPIVCMLEMEITYNRTVTPIVVQTFKDNLDTYKFAYATE